MMLHSRRLTGRLITVFLFCICAVVLTCRSIYHRAEATSIPIQVHHIQPGQTVECQTKLWTFLWNQTVTERFKKPAGFDCYSNSDPLATKQVLTIREVLDSGNFEGLVECRQRVPHYSETPLPKIALASFPGSGTTWTRHLIEQFSEINTGGVACDVDRDTFQAECKHDMWPFTIVIKTHRTTNLTDYDAAVLIIRNPYNAIFSEYNRRQKGKMGSVGTKAFQRSSWQKAVMKLAGNWRRTVGIWLSDFKRPMHILVYERLMTDFYVEVHKLASFLNVNVTYGDLWCLNKNKEGNWHREKVMEPEYTSEHKTLINSYINEVQVLLRDRFQIILPY